MESATRAPIDTVVRIPIADLIVDSNIRRDTKMKPGFAANVKQHGVLEPVDAYQDDNGAWHLQDGQLRYLASLDAGHTDIPVLVQDPALAEAAKLIKQLNKNQQRSDLTEADEANAWATLFDLGVSADAIAKKTNRPRKTVEQALEVNKSTYGVEALEAGLPLDKVAAIIEFEDYPEIVEELTRVANEEPTEFAYALEEAKVDLADEMKRQKLVEDLTTAGVTVVESAIASAVPIAEVYRDAAFNDPFPSDDNPSANGVIATVIKPNRYINNQWVTDWTAFYYVDDPASHGLFVKTGSTTTAAGKAPLTPEQSAERKRVIANNKAWPIANTVRRQWITDELLGRTTLPADIVQFAAFGYAGAHPRPSNGRGGQFTREWLALGKNSDYRSSALIAELIKKPGAANKIILAIALGDAEEALSDKEAWRGRYGDEITKISRYLEQLASWGHNLSDVEAEIVKAGKK